MNDLFEMLNISDGPETFKGFKQMDGTNPLFDESSLEDGYIYFIRTTPSKHYGYIYLNGKKYGTYPLGIDCGEY